MSGTYLLNKRNQVPNETNYSAVHGRSAALSLPLRQERRRFIRRVHDPRQRELVIRVADIPDGRCAPVRESHMTVDGRCLFRRQFHELLDQENGL